MLFIFGELSEVSTKLLRDEKMKYTGTGYGGSGGAARGRVKAVILDGIGHLVPMDAPTVCANHAAEWLDSEMKRWKEEEQVWEDWKTKPHRDKILLPEEWGEKLGWMTENKNKL